MSMQAVRSIAVVEETDTSGLELHYEVLVPPVTAFYLGDVAAQLGCSRGSIIETVSCLSGDHVTLVTALNGFLTEYYMGRPRNHGCLKVSDQAMSKEIQHALNGCANDQAVCIEPVYLEDVVDALLRICKGEAMAEP